MKTLQQSTGMKPGADDPDQCSTHLWLDKSAQDVLREQYHDRCVLQPVDQPKSTRTDVLRPKTYIVIDRTDTSCREDQGAPVGTLVELP